MLNPLTHRKVLKNGVPRKAQIATIGALDSDASTFNLPMTLQVYVEGRTPYEVQDQWMVKAGDTVALSGWIPVRVDPDERDRVAIDWATLRESYAREVDARRQALAASGPVQDLDALGGAEQVMQMLSQVGIGGANIHWEGQPPGRRPPPPRATTRSLAWNGWGP